jgi:predicted RNA-binding Zn ribbon-like protein
MADAERALRWLADFFNGDPAEWRPGEIVDLEEDARAFATSGLGGIKASLAQTDLARLHRELKEQIAELLANGQARQTSGPGLQTVWERGLVEIVADPKRSGMVKVEPLPRPVRRYFGEFDSVFSARARDLISERWDRFRRCARPECGRFFLRNRRQTFCSAECGNRVRWDRYKADGDYEGYKVRRNKKRTKHF